jgi:hypothetical protein
MLKVPVLALIIGHSRIFAEDWIIIAELTCGAEGHSRIFAEDCV